MKNRFTYKELYLLIGIAVAAIILFILWTNPLGSEVSEAGGLTSPKWVLPSVKILVQEITHVIQALR